MMSQHRGSGHHLLHLRERGMIAISQAARDRAVNRESRFFNPSGQVTATVYRDFNVGTRDTSSSRGPRARVLGNRGAFSHGTIVAKRTPFHRRHSEIILSPGNLNVVNENATPPFGFRASGQFAEMAGFTSVPSPNSCGSPCSLTGG